FPGKPFSTNPRGCPFRGLLRSLLWLDATLLSKAGSAASTNSSARVGTRKLYRVSFPTGLVFAVGTVPPGDRPQSSKAGRCLRRIGGSPSIALQRRDLDLDLHLGPDQPAHHHGRGGADVAEYLPKDREDAIGEFV